MRRLLTLLAAVAAGILVVPTAAQANHLHVVQVGSGACVTLAENGHERYVTLSAGIVPEHDRADDDGEPSSAPRPRASRPAEPGVDDRRLRQRCGSVCDHR
jgi:hypothetical protein